MGKYNGKINEYSLGERIRYFRNDRNLTQIELAKMVKLSQTAISLIEKGQMNLSLSHLKSISKALNTHPAILLAEDDILVFDVKSLSKYKAFNNLPRSLKIAVIKIHELNKKWGLK